MAMDGKSRRRIRAFSSFLLFLLFVQEAQLTSCTFSNHCNYTVWVGTFSAQPHQSYPKLASSSPRYPPQSFQPHWAGPAASGDELFVPQTPLVNSHALPPTVPLTHSLAMVLVPYLQLPLPRSLSAITVPKTSTTSAWLTASPYRYLYHLWAATGTASQ